MPVESVNDSVGEVSSEISKEISVEERKEAISKAEEYFAQGKRHLYVSDAPAAVNSLQEACRLYAEIYGETGQECGEIYLYYGKALLELARIENGVLGNALDGVPEGSDAENSQIEDPEKMTEEEKDHVSEIVGDAIEENFKENEKIQKKSQDGEEIQILPDEEKMDTEEKCDPSKVEESGEKSSKNYVTSENESTKDETSVTKSTENKDSCEMSDEVDESSESKPDKDDESSESKPDKDESSETISKIDDTKDKSSEIISRTDDAKDKSSEINSEKIDESTEANLLEKKENVESTGKKSTTGVESDALEKKIEAKSSEDTEENETKINDQVAELKEDSNELKENGKENKSETHPEEESGDEDDAAVPENEADQPEDEEDVGNLQLAWEMLELSKVIYSKQDENEKIQLKIAEIHLKLGEVGLESENYPQSVEDLTSCLNIQTKILSVDDRRLAETHYQMGVAHSFSDDFDKAIESFNSAAKVIHKRLLNLKKIVEEMSYLTDEERQQREKEEKSLLYAAAEIEELEKIFPEVKEKLVDMEQMKKDSTEKMQKLKESAAAFAGVLGGSRGAGESSSGFSGSFSEPSSSISACDKPTSNISHLVKKKRKPEEEVLQQTEAKKAKGVNGATVLNGDVSDDKMDADESVKPTVETATA